jgi:hypothetical protein
MECQKDYVRQYRKDYPERVRDNIPNKPEPNVSHKKCPDCRKVKGKSEFNKNRRSYDGLAAYCREDQNRRVRESRERNKKY